MSLLREISLVDIQDFSPKSRENILKQASTKVNKSYSGINTPTKRKHCCWVFNSCEIFIFSDSVLESNFQQFRFVGAQTLIVITSIFVCLYGIFRLIQLSSSDIIQFSTLAEEDLLIRFYFYSAYVANGLLLPLSVSAGSLAFTRIAKVNWPLISTILTSVIVGVYAPLSVLENFVSQLYTARTYNEVYIDTIEGVINFSNQSYRVNTSIGNNSVALMLIPAVIVGFCTPRRVFQVAMYIYGICIWIPNFCVSWSGQYSIVVPIENKNVTFEPRSHVWSNIVQTFALQALILLVIITSETASFDRALRYAYLLRHALYQERNDMKSLANPFAPAELEKWYLSKRQRFQNNSKASSVTRLTVLPRSRKHVPRRYVNPKVSDINFK